MSYPTHTRNTVAPWGTCGSASAVRRSRRRSQKRDSPPSAGMNPVLSRAHEALHCSWRRPSGRLPRIDFHRPKGRLMAVASDTHPFDLDLGPGKEPYKVADLGLAE